MDRRLHDLIEDTRVDKIIVEGVAGPCPFCHGKFHAGCDQDGEPIATHSLPPCEKFTSLEIDAYVKAVREAIEIRERD